MIMVDNGLLSALHVTEVPVFVNVTVGLSANKEMQILCKRSTFVKGDRAQKIGLKSILKYNLGKSLSKEM